MLAKLACSSFPSRLPMKALNKGASQLPLFGDQEVLENANAAAPPPLHCSACERQPCFHGQAFQGTPAGEATHATLLASWH